MKLLTFILLSVFAFSAFSQTAPECLDLANTVAKKYPKVKVEYIPSRSSFWLHYGPGAGKQSTEQTADFTKFHRACYLAGIKGVLVNGDDAKPRFQCWIEEARNPNPICEPFTGKAVTGKHELFPLK